MSLTREATTKTIGYVVGDMKMATYDISFTLHQLVEPEPGWLLLNGATITLGAYPTLFGRFGSTLPDLTDGKVPIPKGLSSFTTWNATGGEINHTLTTGEGSVHTHADTFSATAGSHSHTGSGSINATNDSHSHSSLGVTLGTPGYGTGGGISDQFDQGLQSTTTGTYGGHGHTPSASVNNTTTSNLSVSGSVSNTGSGGSHNNMQPYLVMGGWLVRAG